MEKKPLKTPLKLLELINGLGKLAGCKINIKKSFGFLYNNNELFDRETTKAILFCIASKTIKYLRINLPKETKVLDTENYEVLIKEIEDDTKK